jgi:hypothetical protein
MQVVSSKWTLSLKLLLPAFLSCFLIGATVMMFRIDLEDIGEPFTPLSARLMVLSFALSFIAIYYLFFGAIKWVAMDTTHLYVSNFKKSYQYTFDSIAKVEETKVLFFKKVTVHFHQPGKFGSKIVFFASYYWHYYLKKNPQILEQLLADWKD